MFRCLSAFKIDSVSGKEQEEIFLLVSQSLSSFSLRDLKYYARWLWRHNQATRIAFGGRAARYDSRTSRCRRQSGFKSLCCFIASRLTRLTPLWCWCRNLPLCRVDERQIKKVISSNCESYQKAGYPFWRALWIRNTYDKCIFVCLHFIAIAIHQSLDVHRPRAS